MRVLFPDVLLHFYIPVRERERTSMSTTFSRASHDDARSSLTLSACPRTVKEYAKVLHEVFSLSLSLCSLRVKERERERVRVRERKRGFMQQPRAKRSSNFKGVPMSCSLAILFLYIQLSLSLSLKLKKKNWVTVRTFPVRELLSWLLLVRCFERGKIRFSSLLLYCDQISHIPLKKKNCLQSVPFLSYLNFFTHIDRLDYTTNGWVFADLKKEKKKLSEQPKSLLYMNARKIYKR